MCLLAIKEIFALILSHPVVFFILQLFLPDSVLISVSQMALLVFSYHLMPRPSFKPQNPRIDLTSGEFAPLRATFIQDHATNLATATAARDWSNVISCHCHQRQYLTKSQSSTNWYSNNWNSQNLWLTNLNFSHTQNNYLAISLPCHEKKIPTWWITLSISTGTMKSALLIGWKEDKLLLFPQNKN